MQFNFLDLFRSNLWSYSC